VKAHKVTSVAFRDDRMVLVIDGETHVYSLAEVSPRLAEAAAMERERFEISPSGYGIHWPLLDEDLSIDGLLGIVHRPERSSSPHSQGEAATDRVP
jgi:hypothetical protein